jgi:predicted SAM-dependent methyltransferase
VKLHLCCGPDLRKGWTNVDVIDFGQEVVADIEGNWLFAGDNSVDHICCKDGFEHVASAEHFLEEAARVLKPGGILEIWVPHYKNPSAYRMTDRRFLSWSYFDVFPEPHDKVQNLRVISNRIYVGQKASLLWKPFHYVINTFPKWFERLFYVSNIEVILQKDLSSRPKD